MKKHLEIEAAIELYAKAYRRLENLQTKEADKMKDKPEEMLLPHKGDQKTGLIGEYWAMRYARMFFKPQTVTFGGHSQKGWDLRISNSSEGRPHYIQVKTASSFGKGRISPVCKPSMKKANDDKREMPNYWDELWLLWLDRALKPVTLWKIPSKLVNFNGAVSMRNRIIRATPADTNTGSECFAWDEVTAIDLRKELRLS